MKNPVKLVLASSLLLAAQAALACDYPEKASIPDGDTASEEEMVEGHSDVQEYVANMEEYLDCIVAEEKAAREELGELEPEVEQQREDMLDKKYNAAVAEMKTVAAQFNAQLQAFRDRAE